MAGGGLAACGGGAAGGHRAREGHRAHPHPSPPPSPAAPASRSRRSIGADAASGTRRRRDGAPWRRGGPAARAGRSRGSGAWLPPRGRGRGRPGNTLKSNITSGSHFRVLPPSPPVTAPGRPHHVPPPPAAAAPMSRKKSGFAITSVRGGSGNAPGDASGAATGSSPSSSGSPSGSRFRLVRLLAPGEVLRRGRWLCRDFYERDASPRGGGGRLPVSLDAPRAGPAPHQPRSLGAFAQLVQQALPPKPPSPRPGGGAELSARLGLAGEESEDEGTGSGASAIDNKIERAMDLVKSHLLLAVREEVEALREQIRELSERRAALERENLLLRALATPQQLARLLSLKPPGPPPAPP
ncbi:sperm acrosome developmental regulator-like [Oenanthe melanoleuca]|uniref:sperm acrosome developmental regulator-like n=1 Tax=Oenanthe melanoleuca TaxID=2939378 RepID=UPI0024C1A97E|nr:sperm acrosome developmental regulator-like [Oenanthe melanoleuca]